MTSRCCALWAAWAIAATAFAQVDPATVDIKTTHVGGTVYMLEGRGGNIGVSAGPDGLLMVDDQFAPLAGKIWEAMKVLSPDRNDMRFILNTHWHGDHTGGNPVFGREGTIIAHDNVRKRLITPQHVRGRVTEALPPEGWPVVTFAESVSIHFNHEEIKVIHFPRGHTDGDSVIFFTGSNVIHMGDHFFAGRFPYVDLESGGNAIGLTENVAKVLEMAPKDAKVIPGHGPLSTVEDLRNYHAMLVETTQIVKDRIKAGKSLEEIQKEALPEKYKPWGEGFINTEAWLNILHTSLQESAG